MKLDRLLGILTVLLQKGSVTAPYLAEKFEVSRRTVSRDIDALCRAGIPVVTRQGGGGGISIAEGYKLDKSVLTADELSGIISALKGLGSVSDAGKTAHMLEKLSASGDTVVSLRESVVIDLASYYRGSLTAKIELIKRAVREQRVISFDYYYEKGESHRQIEPYFVVFQWTAWYVFGFCRDRQDWRMFKLVRLWNLELCEDTYALRDIPPGRTDFNARFTDHLKLIALFRPSERWKLIECYGLDCYTETRDGLRLEIGYTNEDYMVGWLLGFGGNVRVLEPEQIARRVRDAAQNILRAYE